MKLVLIEGIMGSGKTSTAQFIADTLNKQNRTTELYLEGNLDHPADYDAVSWLDHNTYQELLKNHAEDETQLAAVVTQEADGFLVPYGKLGKTISQSLYMELQKHDIYDGISLSKHRDLLLSRWSQFAEQQANRDTTTIFDCAFMQNPICAFLAKHSAGKDAAVEHVLKLAERIRPLTPLLIHFHSRDVRATVERVCQVRSKEWLDFVIRYHTEQAYGQAHGLQGFDGLIEFLEMRQALELEIAKQLPFDTLLIENSDHNWSETLPLVEQELYKKIG